jgi:flagellar hook-associated protein 2
MATVSSTGTLSSLGIGSGLDVNSIVSKLVDLEKQPLQTLTVKASNIQSQISAFGQVQSQLSALTDVATRISDPTTWGARTASSSNSSAATISVTSSADASSFTLDVDQLAQQQSVSSPQLTTGAALGAGTLTFSLGTWTGSSFVAASGSANVNVSIGATDNVAAIAAKINAANTGVVATAFNDGTKDRLLLRSKDTGAAAGFRVQSADATLSSLVFDPQNSAGVGMAGAGIPVQYGQDAKARINGLAVTSASNTLTGNIPGVTISLLNTTTTAYGTPGEVRSPLTMAIKEDVTPAVKNVNDFVTAYNTLNKTLADLTKYDAATKTAGVFQGDSSIVGLQNILRNMLGSVSTGGTYQRLSDVGMERQLDGSLTINTAKLSVAANNGTALQKLFTANNSNALTSGFALKFRTLGRGVLASGGSVTNEAAALQAALDRNSAAQTKVNDRATTVEARLRTQYSALDGQMASLNALSAYVSQQVTLWNKPAA